MITQEQILEFRKLLDSSERYLFFFDDDPDGLCSYLLLRKYLGRGKGVVVKSNPTLSTEYLRKVRGNKVLTKFSFWISLELSRISLMRQECRLYGLTTTLQTK